MALPKAAQQQLKEGERLHKEMYGGDAEQNEQPTKTAEVEESAPEEVQATEETTDNAEPEVVQQGLEVTEEAVEASTDWEHKYKTLQGMYNADVPKLREQMNALKDENAAVRSILATLEEAAETPKPQEDAATVEAVDLLKPEEIQEYGPELVDIIKRAAREEITPELARLRAENEKLRGSLGNVSKNLGETARKSVYTSLSESVPDWQKINKDEAFLEWLSQYDVFSGNVRRELLTQAFEQNDAERVVAFFKTFLDESAMVQSSQTEEPPARREPKVSKSNLVAPGKPRSTGVASTQEKEGRIWTQSDIAAFYRDVQKGKYRGREADKTATERDIVDAANTGRIR